MSEITCRACGETCYIETRSVPYSNKGEEVPCAHCFSTLFVEGGAAEHSVWKSIEDSGRKSDERPSQRPRPRW